MSITVPKEATSRSLCKWNHQPDGSVICPKCRFHYHKPIHYMCQGERPNGFEAELLETRQRREGPGTELKRLLKKVGIVPTPNCKCNKRAALMDMHGSDWCEKHLEEITDWLEEEAVSRGLPFVRLAGTTLIKLSIRKARKRARLYP